MIGRCSVFGCVLLAVAVSAANNSDPCTAYNFLTSSSRDRLAVSNKQQTLVCDKTLSPGWYRFPKGEVAMSKVDVYHCGTESTVWMDAKIPPIGQTTQNKFCFNHMGISPIGCLWSEQTSVKNCGAFLVYKLPLKTMLCPMAICTDSSIQPCPPGQLSIAKNGFTPCRKVKCPTGKWSATGYQPCIDAFPALAGSVHITGPDPMVSKGFRHTCSFVSNVTAANARFEVTWSMDKVPIANTVLSGANREAFFNLDQWKGHLNKKLTCTVKSYWQSLGNQTSKPITSNSYFGGIKITPSPIRLKEGIDTTVYVISTLPVDCRSPNSSQLCQLNLNVISPKLYTVGGCELTFKPIDWNPLTYQSKVPVTIGSVVDPAFKHSYSTKLTVEVTHSLNVTIWKKTACSCQVTVTEEKWNVCISVGDPHFTHSFNPISHRSYNLYHMGDFNFASDTRVPIAVQIETAEHRRTGLPVIGALAVQTGDELVVLDTDGGSKPPTVTANKDPKSMLLQVCGTNDYQISTPMGHRLNIHHRFSSKTHYLDVTATFPTGMETLSAHAKFNRTYFEGCMMYERIQGHPAIGHSNAISSSVIDYFRVKQEYNLFKGKTLPLAQSPQKSYCSCQQKSGSLQAKCSANQKVNDPLINRRACQPLKPRVTTTFSQTRPNEHHFTDFYPRPGQWPTRSGITEKQARQKCKQVITKYGREHCANLLHDMDHIVDACMEDVKASDSFQYITSAVQGLLSICQHEILQNVSNYHNSSTGQLQVPGIVTDLCPNQCSLQGQCVRGRCHCDSGWEWEDCSVKSGQPFKITDIAGGFLCDMSKQSNCFQPRLVVENLGKAAGCNVHLLDYYKGRPHQVIDIYNGTFQREGGFTVACDISADSIPSDFGARHFQISLTGESANHTPQTDVVQYTVYDGRCQMCLSNFVCYTREDACFIADRCYRDGTVEVINGTRYICDPHNTVDRWTTDVKPPTSKHMTVGRK